MYRAENTDFFILLKRIFVIRYNLYVEIFRDEKRGRFFTVKYGMRRKNVKKKRETGQKSGKNGKISKKTKKVEKHDSKQLDGIY